MLANIEIQRYSSSHTLPRSYHQGYAQFPQPKDRIYR